MRRSSSSWLDEKVKELTEGKVDVSKGGSMVIVARAARGHVNFRGLSFDGVLGLLLGQVRGEVRLRVGDSEWLCFKTALKERSGKKGVRGVLFPVALTKFGKLKVGGHFAAFDKLRVVLHSGKRLMWFFVFSNRAYDVFIGLFDLEKGAFVELNTKSETKGG